MNKSDLIDAIAKSASISKASAGEALNGALAAIKEALKKNIKSQLILYLQLYQQFVMLDMYATNYSLHLRLYHKSINLNIHRLGNHSLFLFLEISIYMN